MSKNIGINNEIKQNQQLAEELSNQLLNNLKEGKSIHHLKTIFGMLILQIRN